MLRHASTASDSSMPEARVASPILRVARSLRGVLVGFVLVAVLGRAVPRARDLVADRELLAVCIEVEARLVEKVGARLRVRDGLVRRHARCLVNGRLRLGLAALKAAEPQVRALCHRHPVARVRGGNHRAARLSVRLVARLLPVAAQHPFVVLIHARNVPAPVRQRRGLLAEPVHLDRSRVVRDVGRQAAVMHDVGLHRRWPDRHCALHRPLKLLVTQEVGIGGLLLHDRERCVVRLRRRHVALPEF
ncbi:hypothetical protein T492DRAFT_1077367 [Pavlovales sp. CCMP2436]|nr:hypothetical protein T492DRAFT_1077367 [Pavlovales sp. CCMP2436]|mmetsp:Transcript_13029/g.30610  ORF Transcript_13029/g.30610 Transcript_13029/m.30610 type:complete len:247 (-) Transcript_13029:88-828(-)